MAEALQLVGVLDGVLPFALVGADYQRHLALELGAQSQSIVDHHVAQVVEPAFHVVHPGGSTLQTVCRADVEHQEAVDVADQGFVIQIRSEQIRVSGLHATVAAHIQVPAALGGNDADVFALGLCAFTGTAGHRHLDLVRRTQAAIAFLHLDGHRDTVLHAVTAPGAADTGFDGAQRLGIGVAGLEARVYQFFPDQWQLVDTRTEQVDPLSSGDLGVEVVALGHLTQHDELVSGDLATGDTWHYRVGAVLLHVG